MAADYATLHKDGKGDRDLFQLHLTQLVANAVGLAAAANVTTQIHTVDGLDVCRVTTAGAVREAHVSRDDLGSMVRASVVAELEAQHRRVDVLSDEVRRRIGTAETAILNEIRDLSGRLDRRLERVEVRMGEIEARIGSIEQRFNDD